MSDHHLSKYFWLDWASCFMCMLLYLTYVQTAVLNLHHPYMLLLLPMIIIQILPFKSFRKPTMTNDYETPVSLQNFLGRTLIILFSTVRKLHNKFFSFLNSTHSSSGGSQHWYPHSFFCGTCNRECGFGGVLHYSCWRVTN